MVTEPSISEQLRDVKHFSMLNMIAPDTIPRGVRLPVEENGHMLENIRVKPLVIALTGFALMQAGSLSAAPVAVRFTEGLVHGFLSLRSLDGSLLAHGDAIQLVHGDKVTSRVVFHFKDGSLRDETSVFSQRGNFRLLRYHLVEKGPAFKISSDASIDGATGEVTVRYNEDGKDKVATERLELPPDLANGIIFTLLKNLPPNAPSATFSLVGFAPKPRLVKLAITPQGEEPFSVAGARRTAMHYVLKVEIGGIKGAIAPLVGKQPPDDHVWILRGEAPAFVKAEGALFLGGPPWRIELASPVWPRSAPESAPGK